MTPQQTDRFVPDGYAEQVVLDKVAENLFVRYLEKHKPVAPDDVEEAVAECSRRAYSHAEAHIRERRRRYPNSSTNR